MSSYKDLVVDVPNFPKEGIMFKDITPILENEKAFADLVADLEDKAKSFDFNKLALIESRGFIFGSTLGLSLKTPFSLVRKPGKLPREVYKQSYQLEYGEDSLEVHKDSFSKGDRVLIIDDLLATGGTVRATESLIESTGADVAGCLCVMELSFLKGKESLKHKFESLISV